MAAESPNESELDRVLYACRLIFAAQADKPDAIIDTLGAIAVAHVQGDRFSSHVVEQPIGAVVSDLISRINKLLRTLL